MAHKHMSKEAAIENLRKLFSGNREGVVSLQDVYTAWGRDLLEGNEKLNKMWLSNKLVKWAYHGLVEPVYVIKNSRKTLDKIRLTSEGKKALGEFDGSDNAIGSEKKTITPLDIMKMIAKLREENPEYEVNFDIKLKGR